MFRLCTWIWTFTVIVHSLSVVFTLVLLNKQQGTTCVLPKVLRLEKRCSAHSSLAIFFYLYFLNLTASLHLWPYGGMGPGWWWWWWWWVEGISNLNICKQFWVFSLFILCLWFQSMTMFIIQKIINHWERTIIAYIITMRSLCKYIVSVLQYLKMSYQLTKLQSEAYSCQKLHTLTGNAYMLAYYHLKTARIRCFAFKQDWEKFTQS